MSSAEQAVELWESKLIPSLEANLEKMYKDGKTSRFFHPKMHGCLRAEFTVPDDLDPKLKVGVFAKGKTFPAWIRFSNSAHRSKSDTKQNYHGMAIKLMDVEGKKILKGKEDADTQDFIMVNTPVLNARSLRNAAQAVLAANGNIFVKLWFLFTHIGELIKALKKSPYTNLLHSQYYSQVPISYGEGQAIKFTAIPRDRDDPDILHHDDPDYLRKQLIDELSKGDALFDFAVQFQEDPSTMPIEDPSVEWSSKFHTVATIRIPQQEFYLITQSLFGEHLSFNPWHSIAEHKPLGKINTARGEIYHTLSTFRHSRNGVKTFEPTADTKPDSIYDKKLLVGDAPDIFPIGKKIYQSQFTAIIPVKKGHDKQLDDLLYDIGSNIKETKPSIFSRLRTVHYCRFFLIDKAKNPDGSDLDTKLVFSVVFDGNLDFLLNEVFEELGEHFENICLHCKGYPETGYRNEKISWVKSFRNKEKLYWPAKKGGTVSMIIKESRLQQAIQNYLDEAYKKEDLSKLSSREVRDKIVDFVKKEDDLSWALNPEPGATFLAKVGNILHLLLVFLALIPLLPFIPIILLLAVHFNKVDKKRLLKEGAPPLKNLKDVLKMEDNFYQNQLTIYATIKKPLWFHATYLKIFLFVATNHMRYKSTKGSLGGISSIHFVSWSLFNKGKNGMFLSNYDNGWQSYLSEFIDKAASVMNLSFGNLQGYPAITGLSKDGAHDEQKFKEIVRQFQYPCPIWYCAYPQISVSNVISNSKIRQGLSKKMSDKELEEWLHQF